MANKKEEYLSVRITTQNIYIGNYFFNEKTGVFEIREYFKLDFNFNFQGVNVKECANILNIELLKRNIKTKKIIFSVFSHDITIATLDTIKQKSYNANVGVMSAIIKKDYALSDKSDTSLAYKEISTYKELVQATDDSNLKEGEVVKEKKQERKKKAKEVIKLKSITYTTPLSVLDAINELARLLKKEVLYIDFAPNGVYQYYKRYIKQQNDNVILLHVSMDCTVVTIIRNGVLVDQKVDNFSYTGIQSVLGMYKASLRSNLSNVEETITAINNLFLYTITEEDLEKVEELNEIEKEQIIEAKGALIDYTIDFLERLNIIVQTDKKMNDGVPVNGIYIYHDQANFPDLSSTISDNIELPVQNLMLDINVLTGANRFKDINYLLSTICTVLDPVQLDSRLAKKKRDIKTQKIVIYSIIITTFISSLSIIIYFLSSYMIASKHNTELNQQLIAAKEAEEVFNKYRSVKFAYDQFVDFDKSTISDLNSLDEKLSRIASIMPRNGFKITSVVANSSEGESVGTITLTATARNKDIMAKFLMGLESLTDVFSKVEISGVSDNMAENESEREVTGTVLCSIVQANNDFMSMMQNPGEISDGAEPEPEPSEGSNIFGNGEEEEASEEYEADTIPVE